jgi:hypothetical protein
MILLQIVPPWSLQKHIDVASKARPFVFDKTTWISHSDFSVRPDLVWSWRVSSAVLILRFVER